MNRIVVLTACIAAFSGVACGAAGAGSIATFGSIRSLGRSFDPLCPCGTGIQLINDVGDTLEISIGPSKSRPHGGIRIGSINPADAAAVVVPHGSTEESALVAEIWRYLDTHWLHSELRRLQGPDAYVNPRESDRPALELLRVINDWRDYTEAQRWLDNNTSREEQARIFALPYAELQTDFEREVFENVCKCQGRVFFWGPYSTADSTQSHAGSCH